MENNNILNDVGADDDEDSVPDDDDDDDIDEDEEDESEEEDDDDEQVRVARRQHDGVLEGNVAEPLEPGKAQRLATDADIVRFEVVVRVLSFLKTCMIGSLTCLCRVY